MLHPQYPAKEAPSIIEWGQLYGDAKYPLIAAAAQQYNGVLLYVVNKSTAVYPAAKKIASFYDGPIHALPDWETLPYDVHSPHEDLISDRLKTLATLPFFTSGVLIVSAATLMQRILPPTYVQANSLSMQVGQRIEMAALRQQLVDKGYTSVTQVMQHGEFSVRGSIVDIFPSGLEQPLRCDFFDDELESIKVFDVESQRSDVKHQRIDILPAKEYTLDEASIAYFKQAYIDLFGAEHSADAMYKSISQGQPFAGIEYYLPLLHSQMASLFEYLPAQHIAIYDEGVESAIEDHYASVEVRYHSISHDVDRPILPVDMLYLPVAEINPLMASGRQVQLKQQATESGANYGATLMPSVLLQAHAESPLLLLKQFLSQQSDLPVCFMASSYGRADSLKNMLHDNGYSSQIHEHWSESVALKSNANSFALFIGELDDSIYWSQRLCIIAEHALHGNKPAQRRRKAKNRDPHSIIKNLNDLQIGAAVVHEEHGVGRYQGLVTLAHNEYPQEFLLITYANDDKLYVPVESLHQISRYTGLNADSAPLHSLGSTKWSKAKQKAAEKAHDVAAELLQIQATREIQQGHAYDFDEIEYQAFAAGFSFVETPDQQRAIEAVMEDLRKPQPMDRVVCGDVGFGKTEVALRGAFLAANAGKQVALIAPTTLLVQQHVRNFTERFAKWPIEVAMLSRFNTAKQTREVLQGLANGTIDVVIGTHKLLSSDVKFKQLGLMVVDEEHRFGVRHKEKLKKLRANVDLLTLTATPIPRTLNMSLAGLRDLSIIATPPARRYAVKTFVKDWDKAVIQEACSRELARGGQVYFLHNEVDTIENMAEELRQMLPNTAIEFAHGQMPEKQLETIMADFYRQRFQILLATTIIESGIDIPQANTIIINRADKLGLAQLHQLRGRVGRSHHKAYAYLLVPSLQGLTGDAEKRLQAIASLEDLGVGFTLASHDLEIRGAGELLGEEQSGQIQEIGFTLYNQLLQKSVNALKRGDMPSIDAFEAEHCKVDMHVPSLFPDDYIADVHQRLILYKRLAECDDNDQVTELREEVIDRFGDLPEASLSLFETRQLALKAWALGIVKIDAHEEGGRIVFSSKPNIDVAKFMQLIQSRPWEYEFKANENKLHYKHDETDNFSARIHVLLRLFDNIKVA